MALKQEEVIQQSKRQAEKALHDKQKKDLDKKKKKLKEQYKTLAKGVKYQDLVIGKGMPVQHRKVRVCIVLSCVVVCSILCLGDLVTLFVLDLP